MNYLKQVQRGISFVEEHLDAPVDLEEVSRVSGVSHWHFLRTFRALTGDTLKGYVRGRRLARARRALLTGDLPVLALALQAGFASQASFTRAFRDAYGMPPAQYRNRGEDHPHLDKRPIDEAYLRHLAGGVSRIPEFKTLPTQHVVGLATQFEDGVQGKNTMAALVPALWDRFLPRRQEVENAIEGTCFGIVEAVHGRLEYVAAVLVANVPGEVPEGMVRRTLKSGPHALFTHRGGTATLDHTVDYIYGSWLMQSGQRHGYGPDIEIYDARWRGQTPDSEMSYAVPLSRETAR